MPHCGNHDTFCRRKGSSGVDTTITTCGNAITARPRKHLDTVYWQRRLRTWRKLRPVSHLWKRTTFGCSCHIRWAHCVRSRIAIKRLWRRRSLGRLRSRTRGGGCVVTGTVQRRRCRARTYACDGARVSVHVGAAPEQRRRLFGGKLRPAVRSEVPDLVARVAAEPDRERDGPRQRDPPRLFWRADDGRCRHPSRKSRSCDAFLGGSGLGASGLGGRGSSPSSGTRGLRSIGCGVYLPRTRWAFGCAALKGVRSAASVSAGGASVATHSGPSAFTLEPPGARSETVSPKPISTAAEGRAPSGPCSLVAGNAHPAATAVAPNKLADRDTWPCVIGFRCTRFPSRSTR